MSYGVQPPLSIKRLVESKDAQEAFRWDQWLNYLYTLDKSRTGIIKVTAAYKVPEDISMVLADTTSAGFTVTLPSPVGRRGREITVKELATNLLTVATDVGNIDGSSTKTTSTQYASFTFKSDNANWWIK